MRFVFLRVDYTEAPPHEKPSRFGIECPRRAGRMCSGMLLRAGPHTNSETPQIPKKTWEWDGDRVAPTFSPSINCLAHGPDGERYAGCGWHGYIRKGEPDPKK